MKNSGSRRLFPILTLYCLGLVLHLAGCGTTAPRLGEEVLLEGGEPPAVLKVPSRDSFVGIATAPTEEEAREKALLAAKEQIIAFLGTRLRSETIRKVLEEQTGTEESNLDIRYQAEVQAIANNVVQVRAAHTHLQRWQKSAAQGITYYYKAWALVPFSKVEHERYLADLVGQAEKLAGRALEQGRQSARGGKFLDALFQYVEVRKSSLQVLEITGLPPGLATDLRQMVQDADTELRGLAHGLRLEAENDGQSVRVGGGLALPLVARATLERDGRAVPVAGLPITFTFLEGEGDIDSPVNTDSQGRAAAAVHRVGTVNARNQVEATVAVMVEDVTDLNFPRLRFSFGSRKATILVAIEVVCEGQELAHTTIESAIVGALRARQYEVVETGAVGREADFVLEGSIEAAGAEKANFGNFLVCRAQANLRLVDSRSGLAVAEVHLPNEEIRDTRGYAPNEDRACREAVALKQVQKVYQIEPGDYLVEQLLQGLEEE